METILDYDIIMTSEDDVEVFDKLSALSDTPVIFKEMDNWVDNHKEGEIHIIIKYDEALNRYFLIHNNDTPHNDNGDKMTMFDSTDIYHLYKFFIKMREQTAIPFQKAYFNSNIKTIQLSVEKWLKFDVEFIKRSQFYNKIKAKPYDRYR